VSEGQFQASDTSPGGLQSGSWRFEENKNLVSLPRLEPHFLGHPILIPATFTEFINRKAIQLLDNVWKHSYTRGGINISVKELRAASGPAI
jgi:glutathionylspermidine synthase